MNGFLDEIRIWGVARTASQIAANYNKSIADTAAGLLAYYKFDEDATNQTVYDASPNAQPGSLGATSSVETSDPVRSTTNYAPLTNGCQMPILNRMEGGLTLISEEESHIGIQVFPNPARETVTITVRAARPGVYGVRLTDMSGRSVFRKDVFITSENGVRLQVPLPKTSTSVLLLQVQGNGERKTVKILQARY